MRHVRNVSLLSSCDALIINLSVASSHLRYIAYRGSERNLPHITYTAVSPGDASNNSRQSFEPGFSVDDLSTHPIRHTFPKGLSWTPERLEVNGRKGRRVVCVVAQDKIHYRIFDLDTPQVSSSADDGGERDDTGD